MPEVSVIVPVYNCAEYCRQAIDSILLQSVKDVEIIVVDDGSTDGSDRILNKFFSRGSIRYFPQKNKGPAEARNNGIRQARGRYVTFLDADDFLLPNSLEKRLSLAKRSKSPFIFSDYYKIQTSEELDSLERLVPENKSANWLKKFSGAIQNRGTEYLFEQKDFIKTNFVFLKAWTGTVLADLDYWKAGKAGYFDPKLVKGQDMDMWWRLICGQNTESIGYVDEPLAVYRFYTSSWHKHDQLAYYDYLRFKRLFRLSRPYLSPREFKDRAYKLCWAYFKENPGLRLRMMSAAAVEAGLDWRMTRALLRSAWETMSR